VANGENVLDRLRRLLIGDEAVVDADHQQTTMGL
jgi:hypothetical protein